MKLTQINYQEDEITKDYLIGEDYCLINNFEFKDTSNDEMKSLESISDKNLSICLYGFLQKHPKNTTNTFFVKILHLKQWNFSESGEIIVQSSRYWYKLLNPSPEYAPTFDLFEQRNYLWKELKPILMDFMRNLCNCNNEQELVATKSNITLENILQKLPNANVDSILEHAQFFYEKIVQDSHNFSFDESGENQLTTTPFLNMLKENRFKKKETQTKITKETALIDGIEISDSDFYDEKHSDNTSEDESEDYSESNEIKSKRRKSKKRETPIKKKKLGEEQGRRQKKAMKQVYTTTHQMEQGIPSRDYFLKQEFSPRLLTKLSIKYEPGVCHSACIPCGERGGKVCNREKPTCDVCLERNTKCYYFSSDTFLILAEKNINSAKEKNDETAGLTTNLTTWNDEAYSEIVKEMDEKIKKYSQKPIKDTQPSFQQKPIMENLSKLEQQAEKWKEKAQREKKVRIEIRKKLENYLENLDSQ